MKTWIALGGLSLLTGRALADPTWPASTDELEEIMFQLKSFNSRNFGQTVIPCSNTAAGPGRKNSAEWLRTAFHDMSTANHYTGVGGLDASLQYELSSPENTGPGHNTTIAFMAPYVSKKSSLADLLAMGVYMSVRSCGGPVVPLRGGRVDAVTGGETGVPQPQDDVNTMIFDFDRMAGFTISEMIQMTACGHTIGGVHSEEFPDIVPAGTFPDGNAPMDSTDSKFDNNIITEYLAGTSKDPLQVGPSVGVDKNSDFKVFNADRNATMKTMAGATNFTNTCASILQRMIEVVPQGVNLTDPITPYAVKPVNLQLALADSGGSLDFSGYIRVKTTSLSADTIKSVILNYKSRDGTKTSIITTSASSGTGSGFDDSFAWFPIQASIPVSSGISSFTVTIAQTDGTSKTYNNNGKSYPIQDAILMQLPQSCVASSGKLTITAAVRNDRVSQGAKAVVTYKVAQSNSPSPALNSTTITLKKGDCAGNYTLFSTDFPVPGGFVTQATLDVVNGDQMDTFKRLSNVGSSCVKFSGQGKCDGGSSASGTPISTPGRLSTPGLTTTTITTAGTPPMSTTPTSFSTFTKTDTLSSLSGTFSSSMHSETLTSPVSTKTPPTLSPIKSPSGSTWIKTITTTVISSQSLSFSSTSRKPTRSSHTSISTVSTKPTTPTSFTNTTTPSTPTPVQCSSRKP